MNKFLLSVSSLKCPLQAKILISENSAKNSAINFISKFLVQFDSQFYKLLFYVGVYWCLQFNPDALHRLDARHL